MLITKENKQQVEVNVMKKKEITEILLLLWENIDQAAWDTMVGEAFSKCPISVQKEFISELLNAQDGIDTLWTDEELRKETIEKAYKILNSEEEE